MIIAILALVVLLVVLLACLITRGTCSNAANHGIIPMNSPDPSMIIDVTKTDVPATQIIEPTGDPQSSNPEPTYYVSPGPVNPISPAIPQSPYPSIPYCLTEGTMDDVNARLELLKKLPANETVILLDVGHGGFDGGTVGIDTKVTEADINLQVSRLLAERLAAKGYFVFMTRMGDYAVGSNKNNDMRWRKQVMKLNLFDVSVSIHQNALDTDRNVKGARIYCYKFGTEGENLAKSIISEFSKVSSDCKTNAYTGNLMVVREPICPSALVECGFLSNHDEELLLSDPSYQALIAQAIADGVENYISNH